MNILLAAIANFITEHYILTFLLLISIFQARIDIGKKTKSKDESPKNEEPKEVKNEKEKPSIDSL